MADMLPTPLGLALFPRRVRSSFSVFWRLKPALLALLCASILLLAPPVASLAQPAQPPSPAKRKFRVLALAESGGHHIAFTEAARPWLKKCGEEDGFEVDYINTTAQVTEALPRQFHDD